MSPVFLSPFWLEAYWLWEDWEGLLFLWWAVSLPIVVCLLVSSLLTELSYSGWVSTELTEKWPAALGQLEAVHPTHKAAAPKELFWVTSSKVYCFLALSLRKSRRWLMTKLLALGFVCDAGSDSYLEKKITVVTGGTYRIADGQCCVHVCESRSYERVQMDLILLKYCFCETLCLSQCKIISHSEVLGEGPTQCTCKNVGFLVQKNVPFFFFFILWLLLLSHVWLHINLKYTLNQGFFF